MLTYATLTLLLLLIGSWATYTDWARRSWWYVSLMVLLSAGNAIVFGLAARALDNKERVFVLSLVLDALMVFAYYVLPVCIMGVRPSTGVVAGTLLVIVGFIVIKLGG